MHRLGHTGTEAEEQLQAVLQTVPAATVAADLQAIGDERGLPPAVDADVERYAERLAQRGLKPAEAAELAQRLAVRDRDLDDRRACVECTRFRRIGAVRASPSWYCQHPSTLVKWSCPGSAVLFRCEGFLGEARGADGLGK